MSALPPLTLNGTAYPAARQPIVLVADGEATEYSTLEEARRHLRLLQLNGRYPEVLRLFSCLTGGWAEIKI